MGATSISKWEYKFVFKDDRMTEAFFDLISDLKELAGYTCRLKDKTTYHDYYFDSADLKLESQGMVCRARRVGSRQRYSLVFKRQDLGPNREVIYHQTEPINLGSKGFRNLKKAQFPHNLGPLLKVLSGDKKMEHLLTLRVTRIVVALQDGSQELATICLDRIEAMFPERDKIEALDFEVELKSSRDKFPEADLLADYLRNAFGLVPITRSKFHRLTRIIRKKKEARVRKVILDVDTGVDDALAIILAMQSPEIEVLGITTVGGNVDVDQSARNTEAVLKQIRSMVKHRYPSMPPIGKGQPLKEGVADASNVHGSDGLGGVCHKYLGNAVADSYTDSVDMIRKILQENASGNVTLITTGPLTNLAHWIRACPDLVKKFSGIISMGGVFFQAGNRSQTAEFNVHSDPAAARQVVDFCRTPVSTGGRQWQETLPLTFVGLDVTHRVRFRRQILEQLIKEKPNDTYLKFIREITGNYMAFYYRNEGLDGCYLHDPLAVAYFIDPSLCQAEQYYVEVEDRGEFTAGTTVADYRPTRLFKDKMKEVTWVCYKVQADQMENMFLKKVLYRSA